MPQVSRDQLTQDSVFILQCLRQNARGGRPNGLTEVRTTLEGAVALDLSAYVGFLSRFGYVAVDADALTVTPEGERAAIGDADVSKDIGLHFQKVIEGVEQAPSFEALLPRHQEMSMSLPALDPVEGEIGQGTLSRVRAARLGGLGQSVAVKEYKPVWEQLPWLSKAELFKRVRREATAQAQLQHPCVLPILDVSLHGEEARVVTPLAAGTLRDKLSRAPASSHEPLSLVQTLRIAAQVAHALSRAHEQGLTHGALKPENVLLDRAGNVLLSDFGAARLIELQTSLKGLRIVIELGDAAYRAPEVSASEPAGPAGDAYALGALLHELLAGAPRKPLPPNLPAPLTELVKELAEIDPSKRPSLSSAAHRLTALLGNTQLYLL